MCTEIDSSVTRHQSAREHECPRCGSEIPAYPHYSAWCDICDWNLQPSSPGNFSSNIISGSLRTLGEYADEHLFNRIGELQKCNGPVTWTQAAAIVFSAIVYIFNGLSLWAGAKLIASGGPLNIAVGFAVIIITCWVLWPRFDTPPAKRILTDEASFPMINRIVKRVALALDTDVPSVMLTEQFTATYGRVGWRRQPILGIGHPFLSLLDRKEIVSLLAHELSHSQDGALTRSLFVRMALQSVRRSILLLTPARWIGVNHLTQSIRTGLSIATWALIVIALPFLLVEWVIRVASYQDSQRAEYIADAKSVKVAGTRHTMGLLRKSYYQHLAALRIGYSEASPAEKFNALHTELSAVPQREIDRIWRIAQRQPAQLTGTHPSLPKRIAFLQSLDPLPAVVTISPSEFTELQEELAAWPRVIRKRERDWKDELEAEQAATSDAIPMPSAAD